MKTITAGIVAHVDAGKTTLSEGILYTAGRIRRLGRVDDRDAFLDTDETERQRGITIYSSQADFCWRDVKITLLDTPGHVDFSPETERVLSVLDYAVLVISGADGVQGHTRTLWRLLEEYDVPVFVFVNKMDQPGTDRERLLRELRETFGDGFTAFGSETQKQPDPQTLEEIATCSEEALEEYLESGTIGEERIRQLIAERSLFPVYFGSALRLDGITEFLDGLACHTAEPAYREAFGARIFKITRDEKGNRLTHLKVTGGTLRVREPLTYTVDSETLQEKVNQIRIPAGDRYETSAEISAGGVCAVTGLTRTFPGQGIGAEREILVPILEPVLTSRLLLPKDQSAAVLLPKLRQLEEEQPELHILWNERLQELQAQVMGKVQIEILKELILRRFGVEIGFGEARIVYKETILQPVEGVGHFEPLRHYAEVHLLLEPLPEGSGLMFDTQCSEDMLDKNWQRLVLTHLCEREHRGVLIGAPVTDLKITLIAGRAHLKHTEGGDFRQATYRAVRQGLMEAESVLLEPYYEFRLEVPQEQVGRAMSDLEQRSSSFDMPVTEGEFSVLTGFVPVACLQDYAVDVAAYTRGFGRLTFSLKGYGRCHNEEEVLASFPYDPTADPEHTPDSVFCAHGAGYVVPWNEVKTRMHVESPLASPKHEAASDETHFCDAREEWIGTDEIDAILERTFYANRRGKGAGRRKWSYSRSREQVPARTRSYQEPEKREEYLLVDGYNIIFAWEELHALAKENLDAARGVLLDELCNYQGMKRMQLIAVFDAYRVTGHPTEISDYHNIHVVFTREAETADQYIEKFAHTNASKYRVSVATSDGLEQIIIRGEGCRLLSAKDLKEEIEQTRAACQNGYLNTDSGKNRPFESLLKPREDPAQ